MGVLKLFVTIVVILANATALVGNSVQKIRGRRAARSQRNLLRGRRLHYHLLTPHQQTIVQRASAETILLSVRGNWTHKNVSTNHCGHYNGYRTDCSGFVDYCLHIPSRATSGDYHDFTYSIRKDDLRMGDAIVCPHGGDPNATDTDGGHVVLFDQWENSSNMTKYWLFELCNHPGCRGTYHRLAPYPYDDRASCFLNVAKGGGPRRRRNLCKPTKSPTKAPTTNAPTTKAPSS